MFSGKESAWNEEIKREGRGEREKMRKKREECKPPKDFRYGAPKRNLLHTIAMFFRTLGLNSRRTL